MIPEDDGPKTPEAGFTLVEILVAILILAITLGAIGTALKLIADAANRGTTSIDRLDMIERGMAALRHDLMRIERAVGTDASSRRYVFAGDRRSITFVAVEPGHPTEPGTYLISYNVQQDGPRARLVRSRSTHDPGRRDKPHEREEAASVVVIEGNYRFAFSYLERSDRGERWLDRWEDRRRLPVLIRLETLGTGPRVASVPPLTVRPRIDAETTCLSAGKQLCTPRGRLEDSNGPERAEPAASRQ